MGERGGFCVSASVCFCGGGVDVEGEMEKVETVFLHDVMSSSPSVVTRL